MNYNQLHDLPKVVVKANQGMMPSQRRATVRQQVESAACHCHSSGCQRLLQEVAAQCGVAEATLWISSNELSN